MNSGGLKDEDFCAGGARGVRLKSKASLSWASVDRQVLMQDCWSRFNVRVACGMSLSQRCNGKEGSHLLRPAIRWSLYVAMERSAELVWCRCGGTSWKATPVFHTTFLRPDGHSLQSI